MESATGRLSVRRSAQSHENRHPGEGQDPAFPVRSPGLATGETRENGDRQSSILARMRAALRHTRAA
jgi:hypothetical protein